MDNFTQELLKALASGEKFSFDETVREIIRAQIEAGVNEVMKAEMTAVLGYPMSAQGAASEAGNSRNGYGKRSVATEYGTINILVPRDRNGNFSTALFRPYQRRTDCIGQTVAKLYSAGMTDSEISEFVAFLYKEAYSASTISAITDCIKEDVEAFRASPLEAKWLAIFVDSVYVPLRRSTVSKEAVNIAMGITASGERRVLGWSITPEESAEEWRSLIRGFKERGLASARIVVSDGATGLESVIDEELPGALHQRCFLHLARNLGAKVSKEDRGPIMAEFAALARLQDRKSALAAFVAFAAKWGGKYKSVGRWCEALDLDSAFNFYRFHPSLRGKIYTNNCVEGFNKQIRRLVKKRIQFIDEEAMEKCLVSIFLHYNEKPGKRAVRGKEHIDDELIED